MLRINKRTCEREGNQCYLGTTGMYYFVSPTKSEEGQLPYDQNVATVESLYKCGALFALFSSMIYLIGQWGNKWLPALDEKITTKPLNGFTVLWLLVLL